MADMMFTKPDLELTAKESAAITRLAGGDDIDVLFNVLERWQLLEARLLIQTPREGQDIDLFVAQGGARWLRNLKNYIDAVAADQPRGKK